MHWSMIIKTNAVHALEHDWPKIDHVKKVSHLIKLKKSNNL